MLCIISTYSKLDTIPTSPLLLKEERVRVRRIIL